MYVASISLFIDGGKSTFDVKISAESYDDAKLKLKTTYPNSIINHVEVTDTSESTIKTAISNKVRSESKQIALKTITGIIDDFGNALEIMQKLGGVIGTVEESFVCFDTVDFPDANDNIRCMTRTLVKLGRVEQHGRVTVIYFEMK